MQTGQPTSSTANTASSGQKPAPDPNVRAGILAAGNWIVDRVKMIDAWPAQDALANIATESSGNGGGPYNLLKDLALLKAPFPLEAIGLVGDDANGAWILEDCAAHGIATHQLRRHPVLPTSYTDVMTVQRDGRRTFFHQRGANTALAPAHFDFDATHARIFYLGYLLLLDELDRIGSDGRPAAAAVLAQARKAGLRTVIDTVSEDSQRFAEVILPSLPEVDCCIMNEFEAERTTEVSLDTPAKRSRSNLRRAAEVLIKAGVRELVVLHFVEGAYAFTVQGEEALQGSVQVQEVAGSSGAGDAFAAGFLYGWHEAASLETCLTYGVSVAAASLGDPSTSGGVQPLRSCLQTANQAGFRQST